MNQNFSDITREDEIIASLLAGGRQIFESFEEFINTHHFVDGDCAGALKRMKELRDEGREWGDEKAVYDRREDRPQWALFEIPLHKKYPWMDPGFQIYQTTDAKMVAEICRPLLEMHRRRLAAKMAHELIEKCETEYKYDPAEGIQEMGDALEANKTTFEIDHLRADEIAQEFSSDFEERMKNRSMGISTHIHCLNQTIGGLKPGNLITIGALTAGGKTALGTNLLWSATKAGSKALFVSAEMTHQEIMGRLVSLEALVSAEKILIRPRELTRDEQVKIYEATARLATREFVVDDQVIRVDELTRSAKRARLSLHGLDLIIVDYLQYLQPVERRRSRYEEVTEVTLAVKHLAKKFNVPVVVMAQLNREAHHSVPSLRHFQDTSQIEKESDIALILFRTKERKTLEDFGLNPNGGLTQILQVAKNRNGRTGVFEIHWNPELMLFSD